MRRLLIIWLAGLATMTAPAAVTVSNVTAAQTPGTKQVVITYDVSSTATNAVTISLTVSNGATAVSAPSVSGAVGAGVATGTGKNMTWNMGADWAASVAALAFSVVADDGVIVPAGGDPTAVSWVVVNDRWVKNTYANGDITMSDRTTGLMWPYNASLGGSRTWFDAMSYCDNLTYAGHADWRLPYVNRQDGPDGPVRPRELEEMFSQRSLFSGVQNYYYWSGTSYAGGTDRAWVVGMYNGGVYNGYAKTYNFYVWPVRGGQ
jgi:hypothetical protein